MRDCQKEADKAGEAVADVTKYVGAAGGAIGGAVVGMGASAAGLVTGALSGMGIGYDYVSKNIDEKYSGLRLLSGAGAFVTGAVVGAVVPPIATGLVGGAAGYAAGYGGGYGLGAVYGAAKCKIGKLLDASDSTTGQLPSPTTPALSDSTDKPLLSK